MTTKAYIQIQVGINVEIPGLLTSYEVERIVSGAKIVDPVLTQGKVVYATVEDVISVRSVMYDNGTK